MEEKLREHITDGNDCWCKLRNEGGVVVHNLWAAEIAMKLINVNLINGEINDCYSTTNK